jgi:hypothetical protein
MPKTARPRTPKPTLNSDLLLPRPANKTDVCESCGKGARFGPRDGARRLRCKAHAVDGDVNLARRWCAEAGCNERPVYRSLFSDLLHTTSPSPMVVWCRLHKRPGDVDMYQRLCAESGCVKAPTFGPPGAGLVGAKWCRAHAAPGDVDLKNRRCAEPGCALHPSFGLPGSGSAGMLWCKAHARPGDVCLRTQSECDRTGALGPTHKRRCKADADADADADAHTNTHTHTDTHTSLTGQVSHGTKTRRRKVCAHPGCTAKPRFGSDCDSGSGSGSGPGPGSRHGLRYAIWCSVHARPGDGDLMPCRRCEGPGCGKEPNFGPPGSGRTHARWCKAHAPPGSVNVVETRRCMHPGCEKIPCFGKPAAKGQSAGHKLWCAVHAQPGDVNLAVKMCAAAGCMITASFGEPGSGWAGAAWCKAHSQPGDVNVVSKRCGRSGCGKFPAFGPPGSGWAGMAWCKTHAGPGDVDLKTKRCGVAGCGKAATFGQPGSGCKGKMWCKAHAGPGDVCLTGKPCTVSGCRTAAVWGMAGHQPTRCATHADRPTMVPHPRRKCMKCSEVGMAEYKGMRFCEDHAPEGSVKFLQRPCSSCGLEALLTDGLCEYCDPGRQDRVRKVKEEGVGWALSEAGLHVVARDKILESDHGCVRTRPDFQLLGMEGKWWVYVECDEYQHEHITPECEEVRMRNLAEVRGQPVVFIRFNPDTYMTTSTSAAQLPMKKRYPTLVHWVRWAIENGPAGVEDGATVVVLKLFYDHYDPERPDWTVLL